MTKVMKGKEEIKIKSKQTTVLIFAPFNLQSWITTEKYLSAKEHNRKPVSQSEHCATEHLANRRIQLCGHPLKYAVTTL